MPPTSLHWIAFAGSRCLAEGSPATVVAALQARRDLEDKDSLLLFDAHSGRRVDLDLRGSPAEVLARALPPSASNPPMPERHADCSPPTRGRPRLGVTAREVTLLPRHWEWLAAQPGGSSVALRKLVEQALRDNQGADARRRAREAAYRFMTAMAGDAPGYEEALRALFADDLERLRALLQPWPEDVRRHALRLAGA